MSLGYKMKRLFNNHAETSDNHINQDLQTGYYKAGRDTVMQEIEAYFNADPAYEIYALSKEHGEVGVKRTRGKKELIVVTVIMVRPFHTAVDISVLTESLINMDFGHSDRVIKNIYQHLNRKLPEIKG